MKYFYKRPATWTATKGTTYTCDHPLYTQGTLYFQDDRGIVVIQQRFNSSTKQSWWGPIDPWLVDDIFNQPNWSGWFDQHAESSKDGIFPTFTVRQVMWAMRMKPLRKHIWEL